MDPSMLSHEKNCGQKTNSTAVITAAKPMFTTRATVAISDTARVEDEFPSTRVTSTVEAVPMAESAMVTMLSICKALPTAAAGSEPRGASMNWLMFPIIICMNSSTNSGTESTNTSLAVVFSAGARRARSRRVVRARFAASRAFEVKRAACAAAKWYMGFPSPFRFNGYGPCSIRHGNDPSGGSTSIHRMRIHE